MTSSRSAGMRASMMVSVVEDHVAHLAEYGRVPIGFSVAEVFDDQAVAALGRGDSAIATPLATPYWKDYDSYAGNRPSDWSKRFDVSRWTFLAASVDRQRVGGAVIIYDDPQIDLLHDCQACALLWDLRVSPAMRGRSMGSALVSSVKSLARGRGAAAIRVETQQNNVPACRFYARHGFRLERAVSGAYPDLPGETQLLWRKTLGGHFVAHPANERGS